MARLIYSMLASLDGYVNDEQGDFRWAAPDEEVHAHVNDYQRPLGTYLFGRRMYETLSAWETMDDPAPVMRDYAQIWRAADKVVYSRSLTEAATKRTRIEPSFDPKAVEDMKQSAERDLTVGGPDLAAEALRAGLVDELSVYTVPVVVGAGTPWLPRDLRLDLELLDEHRFANGMVFLRYRPR